MKKEVRCRACGAEMASNMKVCPSCGKKRKKPFYRRVWFYVLIFFAVGMNAVISEQADNAPEGQPSHSKSYSLLGKEMGLDKEQEARVLEIFSQCGIGEIDSVQLFQEGETESSYYVEDDETKAYRGADNTIVVWLSNETKEIQSIYFHDEDIFIDGEAVAKVSDFYVNSEDRNQYRVTAQMLVNELLLVPDSAEYPAISGWAFGIEDGVVIVQSSVKAKNAFGVDLGHKFQVKFENGNPVSLILDGKEYIN